MSLRIGVIVGDEIFRRGLVSIFRDDPAIDVVVETGSGPIDHEGIDVAVVSSSNLGHVEVPCPVVVFTPNGGREPLPHDSDLDISAVLPRNGLTVEIVVATVRAAAAGLRVDAAASEAPPDTLFDERRLEVLALLAQGADTRAIAEKLRYSERTVKTLVHDIELRLGARTRAQAVAEALRLGLI
jgi:DNA-binding NarL/FixJ family response regulator